MFGFASDHLTPEVGEVRSKDGMSVNYVRVGDGAIDEEVVTHQGLILAFSRGPNHTHDPAGACGLLDLAFREAFVILPNCRDRGFAIGKGCIIDEDEGSIWSVFEVKDVKAIRSRRKLDYPSWSKNFEDTPTIFAVISDVKLLAKLI